MDVDDCFTALTKTFLFMLESWYLLDKLLSVSAHIVDSVSVHGEVGLECFMLFQQALRGRQVFLKLIITYYGLKTLILCNGM